MKVKMNNVIKLFVDLGFTTAPRWSLERLKRKVEGLPDVIDEDTDAGESQSLLDDLLVDLDNEDEIVILETEEAEDPKPKKKKKKKKVVGVRDRVIRQMAEGIKEKEEEPEDEALKQAAVSLFKELLPEEEEEYREWARENYQVHSEINPVWHPAVCQECELMNEEDAAAEVVARKMNEEDAAAQEPEPEEEEGEEWMLDREPEASFQTPEGASKSELRKKLEMRSDEVVKLMGKVEELTDKVKELEAFLDPADFFKKEVAPLLAKIKDLEAEVKRLRKQKSSDNGKPRKKGKKKVGVISAIIVLLKEATKDAPISKEGLHKRLVEKFPDRSYAGMMATISSQVPSRLISDKGLKIEKSKNGFWIE